MKYILLTTCLMLAIVACVSAQDVQTETNGQTINIAKNTIPTFKLKTTNQVDLTVATNCTAWTREGNQWCRWCTAGPGFYWEECVPASGGGGGGNPPKPVENPGNGLTEVPPITLASIRTNDPPTYNQ